MPLPLPEKIEVKLAFVPADTAAAMAQLGLQDPPKEEKEIHFFDTEELALFGRGLILRVRKVVLGDDPADATLKVRGPAAPDAAERFLAAAGDTGKYEGDQNAGRAELPSFSITMAPGAPVIDAIAADPRQFASVLNEPGQTLLSELGGEAANSAGLISLGPIRSRSWKVKPKGFAKKITAELWDVAGQALLELSDKVTRAEAPLLEANLLTLLGELGLSQLDSSKTKFALELLRAATKG